MLARSLIVCGTLAEHTVFTKEVMCEAAVHSVRLPGQYLPLASGRGGDARRGGAGGDRGRSGFGGDRRMACRQPARSALGRGGGGARDRYLGIQGAART